MIPSSLLQPYFFRSQKQRQEDTETKSEIMEPSNTLALPTVSALRHLEPRPGGQWVVTGQSSYSYSLAYIMDGEAEAIHFTMQPCATEEDVRNHCASLIYSYSEGNFTDLGSLSATQNTTSEDLHLILKLGQGNGSNGSSITGLQGFALDPQIIGLAPGSQNNPNDGGQKSLCGHFTQTEIQNNFFELSSGSTNNQSQQRMMNGINGTINWHSSETVLPTITTIAQLPNVPDTMIPENEDDILFPDFWGENFAMIEPMGDSTSGQSYFASRLPYSTDPCV